LPPPEAVPDTVVESCDPTLFDFNGISIAATQRGDGTVLIEATKAARAMGYTNPHKAILDHCKGANVLLVPSTGGPQQVKFIPEFDVYRLVMRSNLPEAEKVKAEQKTAAVTFQMERNRPYADWAKSAANHKSISSRGAVSRLDHCLPEVPSGWYMTRCQLERCWHLPDAVLVHAFRVIASSCNL
jgi:hypothetical protein